MTSVPLRVLLIADFRGPTQHISFYSPLDAMVQQGDCQLATLTEPELQNAGRMAGPDERFATAAMQAIFADVLEKSKPHLVIFSRYGGPIVSHMLRYIRKARIPLLAHFDDDLLGVPLELGPDKFRRYNDPGRLSAIREVLDESDLIYASTAALAERLRERGVRVPIIAGKIYCSGQPFKDISYKHPPVVGYMGSGGHAHDLAIALPGIIRLLNVRPDLRFELFGTIPMPDSLRIFGSRVVHHAFNSDYDAFLRQLARLGWSVGLAPLADIPFNAVKANTKWVEYTCAGIAVVAGDHPVYRDSCRLDSGLLVGDQDWFDAIARLIDNPSEREAMVTRARLRLETEFSPQRLRAQVLDVFSRAPAMYPTNSEFQEARPL